VVAAYQTATESLRSNLEQVITALWVALGSYRDADRSRFVQQVAPIVLAAQRQMSALTTGYHNARRTLIVGRSRSVRVDPASVSGAAARNGTDPADVYGRPFDVVWRELAKNKGQPNYVENAIKAGLDHAVQLALTDVQLSKTQTSQRVMADDNQIVGYRRVLEGSHSCGLCIVAATLRYHKSDLLPIHPACDCSVAEIFGTEDPGKSFGVGQLGDVHDRIAERFGESDASARAIPGQGGLQYRDVLITHEHGELGPILAVRGQNFTGPTDLEPAGAQP
jgi:hypothetical protein